MPRELNGKEALWKLFTTLQVVISIRWTPVHFVSLHELYLGVLQIHVELTLYSLESNHYLLEIIFVEEQFRLNLLGWHLNESYVRVENLRLPSADA